MRPARLGIGIIVLSLLFSMVIGCQHQFQPGTFTDDAGREITIEKVPQRIVSHVPNITETLFALNLGDRVVGVSDYCNYPAEAELKPSVGNFHNPSIEKIVSLAPDLVLTNEYNESIRQLDNIGITFIVLDPNDIDGILNNIELLGEATGAEKEAESLRNDMENRIAQVISNVEGASKVKVFYLFATTDLNNPWTAGPSTFVNSLITMAGGENIAARAQGAWIQFSIEEVVAADPGIILVDASHGTAVTETSKLRVHPAWRELTAVKQGKVFTIDGDLINRSGPRIVLGLEEVAKIIHPERLEQ